MKIVTLYNHKGGVSKTTTTFNLASYLAGSGKRVLIVDADPQCNLTEISLAPLIADLDDKSAREKEIFELPGTTILDALNQRIKGDVPFIDVDQIELNKVSDRLLLLRGSVDLSSIEDDLAEAHVQRMAQRTNLMRTYVAVGDMLVRLARKNKLDYVFIDVGPSSGALTRAFFLACDYFFLPVAPDRFNVQAVGTLARVVNRWMREHLQAYRQYSDLGLPVRPGTPAFLGSIVQSFKIYKGQPKPAFKLWQDRIPKEVVSKLKPALQDVDPAKKNLYLPSKLKATATSIPDFGQLAPLMQEVGKAIFNISQNDTARITESGVQWVGKNWTHAQQRMTEYKKRFKELADVLEGV